MASPSAMSLDPRRLETFRQVALAGSVTEAARRMALSQPAVTAQVRQLEEAFGRALFRRSREGMALTDAGQELLEVAERLHELLAGAMQALAERPVLGVLELGASTTLASYVLPPLLASFLRAHPGVGVKVRSGNTREMLEALRTGALPLALVEGLPRAQGLRLEPFLEDELVLVAPARCEGQLPRRVADLRGRPLLWREPGSGTRAVVERALARAKPPRRVEPQDLELGHTEAIKTAMQHGLGFGFLSRWSVQREVADRSLRILPLLDLRIPRRFSIARGHGQLSAEAAAFLRHLERNPPRAS